VIGKAVSGRQPARGPKPLHRRLEQTIRQHQHPDPDGRPPYDPNTGRFLTTDPIDGGSLNNYDYAGQDPINGYDLSGTCNYNSWYGGFCPFADAFTAIRDARRSLLAWENRHAGVMSAVQVAAIVIGGRSGDDAVPGAELAPEEVTGITQHGNDSLMGHDGVGVSNSAVLDTIRNPAKFVRGVTTRFRSEAPKQPLL
jgi:hypothetical protein